MSNVTIITIDIRNKSLFTDPFPVEALPQIRQAFDSFHKGVPVVIKANGQPNYNISVFPIYCKVIGTYENSWQASCSLHLISTTGSDTNVCKFSFNKNNDNTRVFKSARLLG